MTVLHYVEHWLDLSAGFVHAHVSRSRHRGVVVSHNRTENRDAFPFRPVISLAPLSGRVPARRWPRDRTRLLTALSAVSHARLVHVHFGYVVGDVTDFVRRRNVPLVLSLHGSDATALPREQPDHYAEAARQVQAVIVPSRFLAAAASDLGFDPERIHIVPAGIDTAFFSATAPPADPTVAFVGRLVEKKGLDVLLKAWPAVVSAVPAARLTVLGDGPLAPTLPVGDPSVLHLRPEPARRAEQVRETLRAARVIVTPSRTAGSGDAESLLLVNLEAQSSGRAVVTTEHGGIPEFVRAGESALVVPENDPRALAAALTAVLTDNALADRLAAAGPAVAAAYDVHACVARVDALYDELLARPR